MLGGLIYEGMPPVLRIVAHCVLSLPIVAYLCFLLLPVQYVQFKFLSNESCFVDVCSDST